MLGNVGSDSLTTDIPEVIVPRADSCVGWLTSRRVGRGLTLGVIVSLTATGSAWAAGHSSPVPQSRLVSSNAIKIGNPTQSGQPSVVVDTSGEAIVAWADTADLGGATDFVQYCVLPVGASACREQGNLVPADSAQFIDDVQVLYDGGTVVVLADVYGATSGSAQDFEPEQEWQSTDGGATFSLLDGGRSVSSGIISADTGPLGAVITPGTGVLGYGWETAEGPPTFNAFPLSSPPECSIQVCAAGFARLEPSTNADQVGNLGGQMASQSGTNSGVMGVFATDYTTGPLGCSGSKTVPFGTAYAYGRGQQSASNNYNLPPGRAGSAWRIPATQADCNVEFPAVAGGPSGFGVLEDNELQSTTVYHPFDQATSSFDGPMVTVTRKLMSYPAVSQDGAGGVYATYLDGGNGGPVSLSYSFNGGTTWSGPGTLDRDSDLSETDLTSSVNAAGQGWAVWEDSGAIYATPFTAQSSVPAPAHTTVSTTQTSGTTSGSSISIPAGTVGETDTATIHGTNAAHATGTVTYQLFANSTCVASSLVATSTENVTHGAAAPSAGIAAALAPGKYFWVAKYSGNPGNDHGAKGNAASMSKCGTETLTVK